MTDPHPNQNADGRPPSEPGARAGRGLIDALLAFFSSVRLGIVLLVVLFFYCSIGSADIWYPTSPLLTRWAQVMPRQWPMFEMTEFEWFHTPFFVGLCALICVNLSVATVRRIPFRVVNLGVWMIHSGIIVLAIGSVIYFGTKTEGDTPVFRRAVSVTLADGATFEIPALPGASERVMTPNGAYRFSVAQVDPDWPILSGEHEGVRAYSVTLSVETPSRTFMRQVIDGFPQYTEDVIPGQGRAVKLEEFGGKAITDDSFSVSLDYLPQTRFWIKDSSAIAVRTVAPDGTRGPWVEMPLENLPRYNDRVANPNDVLHTGDPFTPRGLSIPLDTRKARMLDGVGLRVTGFVRYGVLREEMAPGGERVNPVLTLSVSAPMVQDAREQMIALDPRRRFGFGNMALFEYAPDQASMDATIERLQNAISGGGGGAAPPLAVVAGPDAIGMRALVQNPQGAYTVIPIGVGEDFAISEAASAKVVEYIEKPRVISKPMIVPRSQRDHNADQSQVYAMVRLEVADSNALREVWLAFHRYAFDEAVMAQPGLGRAEPTLLAVDGGVGAGPQWIEVIYTRESAPLRYAIALDDFVLTTHVGGYTGDVSSVRDWTSELRYRRPGQSEWSDIVEVATNAPAKFGGFQYYQAFWDAPPRRMSGVQASAEGLNFTGLGVGNRLGVGTQLAGSCLSVIGMIYAFYIKPIIKRRRRARVIGELGALGVAQGRRVDEIAEGRDTFARQDATQGLAARRAFAEEGQG